MSCVLSTTSRTWIELQKYQLLLESYWYLGSWLRATSNYFNTTTEEEKKVLPSDGYFFGI